MANKFKDIKRISQVVNALIRHDLGYFVQEYGLGWHLHFLKRLTLKKYKTPNELPVKIRKVFEDLGGGYIKLGQLLSLRPDLVPNEYCEEFKKLLDKVEPFPFKQVEEIISKDLNRDFSKIFLNFEKKPIGSASVAQVHAAKLRNGKTVVVKVQRPNARDQFESDIDIMKYLAHLIEKKGRYKNFSPSLVVKEFERYTKNELNFIIEARNIDRFYKSFSKSAKVVIPRVYWGATSERVLVMDYIKGVKLAEINKHKGYNNRIVANNLMETAFKQFFDLGFFHADMHPANILILSNNRIALLDFGIVGSLDKKIKRIGLDLYVAIVNRDEAGVVKALLRVGTAKKSADVPAFEEEVKQILGEWYDHNLKQVRISHMMHLLFNSCIKNGIKLPPDVVLIGKALVTVEGTCLQLNPEFNFVQFSRPKIASLLKKQRNPKFVLNNFLKKSKDFADLISDLPSDAQMLIEKIKRGVINVDVTDTDVKHLGMDINKSSNRLSFALMIASLIVASALLVKVGPEYAGYSIASMLTLFMAIFLIIPLTISILREGSSRYDPHKRH